MVRPYFSFVCPRQAALPTWLHYYQLALRPMAAFTDVRPSAEWSRRTIS